MALYFNKLLCDNTKIFVESRLKTVCCSLPGSNCHMSVRETVSTQSTSR